VPSSSYLVNDRLSRFFPSMDSELKTLTGNRSRSKDTNLYTISLDDMQKTSPICLLSKASKTKSWLWNRQLSHLNFACALGKSMKSSHQSKAEDTNQEKLYLPHTDLCGLMCVKSINGKKYILVIVDDYSRFTLVKFLISKDEVPEDLSKLNVKADIGIFVGYAPAKKAFRIYNKRIQKIIENIHTRTKLQFLKQPFKPTITEMIGNGLSFQPMFYEYFNPPSSDVSPVQVAAAPRRLLI
ncbi:integrase, catalytic region, zinc finger, CCHC-type containing protein, partial [Tanacetum coccineum]